MSKERISVHICTADRSTETAVVLTSLYNQTFENWDLILLDDQSNIPITQHYFLTNLIQRIRHDGHGVKVLRNNFSKGIGHARNLCMKNDKWNELIVRVDDDSIMNKDYLQKLYNIATGKNKYEHNGKQVNPNDIGGVGGIVPLAGQAETILNANRLGGVFNRITYSPEGIINIADDGGYSWTPEPVLPSHHLRSSFLFRKSAWKKVGGYPSHLGQISFREESIFSIKLLYANYVLLSDLSAKCWHSRCMAGGCRTPNYAQEVALGNEWFTKWAQKKYLKLGVPWKHEAYR